MNLRNILLSAAATIVALPLTAQPLRFEHYMDSVRTHNIDYLVERCNIDVATAQVEAARVFNDPELSVGYSNNQDHTMQMGQSYEAGLGYSFSLGGLRRARIGVARSEKALTEASVDEFFRNLQADAAIAWAEAWRTQQQEHLALMSYEAMQRIAQSDSLRLKVGEINPTDASQSQIEAQTALNEYLARRNDAVNARQQLTRLMGGSSFDSLDTQLIAPTDLPTDSSRLIAYATAHRADLKMAERMHDLSEQNLKLVKANRAMELGLNAGYAYNTIVRNEIAPAPAFHGVTIGVSIPLKFSSLNRGAKQAAQAAITQSEMALQATLQQIRNEVVQSLNNYLTAREVVGRYNQQLLSEAQRVLRNRTYGYQHGESGLLDLLTARRTYNEVYNSYIEAQSHLFVCYYELYRTAGY